MKSRSAVSANTVCVLIAIALIGLSSFTGCTEDREDPAAPLNHDLISGVSSLQQPDDVTPWAALIDFEALLPAAPPEETPNGLVDPATGMAFSAVQAPDGRSGPGGAVGQVTMRSIDGCQELIDASRKLGTAYPGETPGTGSLGIRMSFPEPIVPPLTISVEFYTRENANTGIQLFSAAGTEVASRTEHATPAGGHTCAFSDLLRSRTVVTLTSHEPVAFAVFSVTERKARPGEPHIQAAQMHDDVDAPSAFVIDNVRYGSFIAAGLDIRPGDCPNPLNPKSHGVLPAAVLGDEGLDVREIDLSSLRLEGVSPIPGAVKYKSVSGAPGADCVCSAGSEDEYEDLELKFRTREIAAAIDPVWPHEVKELTLTGNLVDGTPFVAADCVKIVGIQEATSEIVTAPHMPTGPSRIYWVGTAETYCAGGAVSTSGHLLQYRFWFDDVDVPPPYTEWQDSTCVSHPWDSLGTFNVRAQARCAIHPDRVSELSEPLVVTVAPPEHVPVMHFATSITRIWPGGQTTVTKPYDPAAAPDTVGMFRPFSMSYHGTSLNGPITEYRYLSLTPGVDLPGAGVWYGDLSDTLRSFPNTGDQTLPTGVFRLGAQCRDVLGAESIIDAGTFDEGVCQVVVNFDPNTEIFNVVNSYMRGGIVYEEPIDLSDAVPDTVPYNSWIRVDYVGWDSPFDSTLCTDPINDCIRYQMSYRRYSDRFPWVAGQSAWLPYTPTDTNPFGKPDSMSMNVGTIEYDVLARSVDENDRPDGTPASVPLVGNFDPTLDEFSLENHTGHAAADGDTIVWDWWAPADSGFDLGGPLPRRTKTFHFDIKAAGHDHPKDPDGSGVKGWFYEFRRADDPSIVQEFARSGGWVEGTAINVLNDRFEITFTYAFDDLNGDEVFNNLPDWINRGYDFTIRGRDTGLGEQFNQYVIVNGVQTLVNSYNATTLGRWTAEEGQRFYLVIRR